MLYALLFAASVTVGFGASRVVRNSMTRVRSPRPAVSRAPSNPVTVNAAQPAATAGPLAVRRGDTGELVNLVPGLSVGRSSDNTITSLDERVSRTHVRFEPAGNGWVVIDQGSANGTWIDGARIPARRPIPVQVGTVVGVGPLELHVTISDRPTPTSDRWAPSVDRTQVLPRPPVPPAGTGR